MRWTVHGVPRVPWDAEGIFDGISTFKVDSNGKIFEHAVNNVVLRDPPSIKNPLLAGLSLARLAGQQQQQPCPGAWFKVKAELPSKQVWVLLVVSCSLVLLSGAHASLSCTELISLTLSITSLGMSN